MKAVWDACKAADVDPPPAVVRYFEDEDGDAMPDESGIRVSLYRHESVKEWSNDHESGLMVDLGKLPEGVTLLRFYNSW